LQAGYLAELFGAQLTVAVQAGAAALALLVIAAALPGLRRPIQDRVSERAAAASVEN
jgi:hypothetical protein